MLKKVKLLLKVKIDKSKNTFINQYYCYMIIAQHCYQIIIIIIIMVIILLIHYFKYNYRVIYRIGHLF